jgi:hypothetical protein
MVIVEIKRIKGFMEVLAYLDAGTGSIIIQALIGAVVAVGVVMKVYWAKLTGIFKKSSSENNEELTKTQKKEKKPKASK